MLIEQAFYNLPEILVGARYPTQGYEGGLVAAFSMAILQELNGRNANNPISHLIAERLYQSEVIGKAQGRKQHLYQTDPFRDANDKPRYLRADLHVSLGDLRTGTHALSRYGWRWSNWIEAKFYRDCPSSHSPQKSSHGGLLAADLMRLMALPPVEEYRAHGPGSPQSPVDMPDLKHKALRTGRYLLHVYQGPPENYHAIRRNKRDSTPGGKRTWLEGLLKAGQVSISTLELDKEPPTFIDQISPGLIDVDCTCQITNFVMKPLYDTKHPDAYHCILSRIDCFELTWGQDSWKVTLNRIGIESSDGAFNRIRRHVGNLVHSKVPIEETPPDREVAVVDAIADVDIVEEYVPSGSI